MSVLFILLGASLVVAGGFLVFFIWAVKSGQFDDTGTPPLRVLGDDEPAPAKKDSDKRTQERGK